MVSVVALWPSWAMASWSSWTHEISPQTAQWIQAVQSSVASLLRKTTVGGRGCPVAFLGNGFLVLLVTRDKSSDCTLDSGGAVFSDFLVKAFGTAETDVVEAFALFFFYFGGDEVSSESTSLADCSTAALYAAI